MQKNKKIPGRPVKKGGLSRSGIMLIVVTAGDETGACFEEASGSGVSWI